MDWTRRLPLASAAVGAAAWAAWGGVARWHALDALALFAPLVLVPLGLALVARRDRHGRAPRLLVAALVLQPPAALLLLVGGGPAALAWLLVTALLGLHGAQRFVQRGARPLEEALVDVGLAYLPVGGAWLAASRFGLEPMGFREPIVLLTAIHFHYAAFAVPVMAGVAGRALLPRRAAAFRVLGAGLVLGPVLLAAGITLSRALEVAAAVALAGSVLLWAALVLGDLRRFPAASRAPLALASLCALVSMPAAVLFALRAGGLDVPTMARVHGAVNAYGVTLLGIGGLVLARLAPRAAAPGKPFSALRSRGHTGPDHFDRTGAVDATRAPAGLVDDLRSYASPGFDPARVHPDVRAFYERTRDHQLLVVPRWGTGARWLGRVYGAYARRAGQMRFPMEATREGRLVRTRIVAVRDDVDGRTGVRAWVRTYADTGEPVYVAAYASHRADGVTYMNIAFPFPGWNLTSVLRLEGLGEGGVRLTTLPPPSGGGDQGVHAVRGAWHARLPINETIRVWAAGDADAPFPPLDGRMTVLARHEMWALGVRFLTLDYHIFPSPTGAARDGSAGGRSSPPSTPAPSGARGSGRGP